MKTNISLRIRNLLYISIIGIFTSASFGQTLQDTLEYPWQYIGSTHYLTDTICDPPDNSSEMLDQLIQTTWVPNLPGGIIPYDMIYCGVSINKLFVYGDRKIIVIDGITNEVIHEIYLSDYGNESLAMYQSFFNTKEKHLAWNPDINMIYCVDANMNLYLIDPLTYAITPLPNQISGINTFDYTILKYNDLTNQLFWLIGQYGFSNSKLIIYLTDNQSINKQYELNFNQPFDFEFHPIDPTFYISDNNYLYKFNSNNAQEITNYDLEIEAGEIIIAFSMANNTNKVYCLPHCNSTNCPDANILVLSGSSYSFIPVDHTYYTAGFYNENNNMLFVGYSYYNQFLAGVSVYLANNQNALLGDHEFQAYPIIDYISDFTCIGNKTIGCSRERAFFFNNQQFLLDYIFDENLNAHYFRICNDATSKVYLTDSLGGQVDIFSTNTYNLLQSVKIGSASYHGFIDQGSQKLYTYNFHDKANHELISYDLISKEINVFDIGYWPTGIAHDPVNSKIYITNKNQYEISIQVLDCNENTLSGQNIIINGFNLCDELLWTPDNTLYISAQAGWNNPNPMILIYDLTTHSIKRIIPPYLTQDLYGHDTHFLFDPNLNKVFVSIKEWLTEKGRILIINNDPVQSYPYSSTGSIADVDKLKYNEQGNSLIIKQFNIDPFTIYDKIYLLNLQTLDYASIPVKSGVSVCDIEFDSYRGNIYCTFDDNSGHLYKLDGETGNLLQTIHTRAVVNSLLFNPLNKKIYIHAILDLLPTEDKWKEELLSFDPDQQQISTLYLGQNVSNRSYFLSYITDIIHDEESNTIYLTNAQSNIKVIQCTSDQIELSGYKWNWLSFPNLDRSSGDPTPEQVVAQENFDQGYTELEMVHLLVDENQEAMTSVVWNQQTLWQYDGLNYVYSEKGYKLRLEPEQERTLYLTGSILEPQTQLHLYAEKHNWVGYFLKIPQSPFDAIPENITNNLYSMVSQYWWCYNYALIQPPPTKSTSNTTSEWRCACNQLNMELNYGDMVILHSKEEQDFAWNQSGSDPNLPNKDAPENFVFEEQADYNAYFIELDTNDLPDEIGAFAGDTCIGATKVLPGDSTVLICGYDDGFEGEEICFQTVYDTKSTKPVIDDYRVLNTQTGIMEKRKILVGEPQPFYLISLKTSKENEPGPSDAWIRVFPNPAKQKVSVSYFIPVCGDVKITINGIVGGEWYSEKRGYQPPGEYKFDLNNDRLPAGCYLVTLQYNHQAISDKLMIFK